MNTTKPEVQVPFRIANWDGIYENNRTREMKRMDWIPVPNRMDGDGYTELLEHPNGASHLGAWLAILQVASRCKPRGILTRDGGGAHTALSLSRISRIRSEIFEEVLPRLLTIGWIESPTVREFKEMQEGAGIPQEGAECPPDEAQEGAPRAHAGTEGNGTEGNGKNTPASDDAEDGGLFPVAPVQSATQRRAKAGELTPQQQTWFDEWWGIMWLHRCKKEARVAFAKHVKTEERFQLVMFATREQTPELLRREDDKRPHGATWLNGERWEDSAARARASPNSPQLNSSQPPRHMIL